MAITLTELTSDTAVCEVSWGEDNAEVVYRPSAYTPRMELEFHESLKANQPGQAIAGMLAGLLVSWEIVDDAGEELAPTFEALSNMPVKFLIRVFETISQHIGPDASAEKNSGAASRRVERSAKSRTGSR